MARMNPFPALQLAAALAALTLTACGPAFEVAHNHDANASFNTLKTYAWASGSRLNIADPTPNEPAIERAIVTAVDKELARKGYTQTSADSADFLVGYAGTTNRRIQTHTVDTYYGYRDDPTNPYRRPWGSPENQVYASQYDEGTLIIDVSTAKSKHLIWRGHATTALLKDPTPERSRQRINEAVRKILAGFPPE